MILFPYNNITRVLSSYYSDGAYCVDLLQAYCVLAKFKSMVSIGLQSNYIVL